MRFGLLLRMKDWRSVHRSRPFFKPGMIQSIFHHIFIEKCLNIWTYWHFGIAKNAYFPDKKAPYIGICQFKVPLLKNAPIILLDEATASLDVENETKVQGALSRLIQGKSVLVIAHRMRTVEAADKIVVLADGRVAEQGTSRELMSQNGQFAQMVRLQTESQTWSIV